VINPRQPVNSNFRILGVSECGYWEPTARRSAERSAVLALIRGEVKLTGRASPYDCLTGSELDSASRMQNALLARSETGLAVKAS
jgi:hypothetical protein